MRAPLRVLVVTTTFPWPEASGTAIRNANVIRALARLGDVDLCCILAPSGVNAKTVPDDAPVARVLTVARPARPRAATLRSFTGSRMPRLFVRDYAAVQRHFREWAGEYDFVWLGRLESAIALADHVRAPFVCDLDDLEDRKLARQLDTGTGRGSFLRGVVARGLDRRDVGRLRRLQDEVAGAARAVVVCSDADRVFPNAMVVPNAYPEPERAVGRVEVSSPPTLTFVGLLSYEPNADAASFLVQDVMPELRAHRSDAQLRIVGRRTAATEHLGRAPGVTLAGFVPDIESELAQSDVVVVPVRFGGGTRVKILEAFAHRIPVVATTIGAEGLGVRDREHLLVADSAASFAAACAELLSDTDLRRRLTDAAHAHWYEYFRPAAAQQRVLDVVRAALVTDAAGSSSPRPG